MALTAEQDDLLARLLDKYWLAASDTIAMDEPVDWAEADGTTSKVALHEPSVEMGWRTGFLNALQVIGAGLEQTGVMIAATRAATALEEEDNDEQAEDGPGGAAG